MRPDRTQVAPRGKLTLTLSLTLTLTLTLTQTLTLTVVQVGDEIFDYDKGLDVVERMFRTSTARVPSDARAHSLASRPVSHLSHAAEVRRDHVWTTPESRAGSGAPSI